MATYPFELCDKQSPQIKAHVVWRQTTGRLKFRDYGHLSLSKLQIPHGGQCVGQVASSTGAYQWFCLYSDKDLATLQDRVACGLTQGESIQWGYVPREHAGGLTYNGKRLL